MSIITILHEGEWKAAEIVGYGIGGSLAYARLNETYVAITTSGSTFAPRLVLSAGPTAVVRWLDLNTGKSLAVGTAPTIEFGSSAARRIGFRVEVAGTEAFGRVTTLNFGFNHNEDAGRNNLGAGYDYASQQITGISGLQVLTGLRNFLAAGTPLTGHVDFTGLTQLQYIECFGAQISSIDLTGCTGLIRLCMERNHLTSLDLNPVRTNLVDLRAAVQYEGVSGGPYALTFTTLTGPMTNLYHYCIRDQAVYNIVPHSQLPVIEQYWVWNTGQTTSDTPTSAVLTSFIAYQNAYDQASVDRILVALNANVPDAGTVDISGGAAPSGAGLTAATSLSNKNWTVTIAS